MNGESSSSSSTSPQSKLAPRLIISGVESPWDLPSLSAHLMPFSIPHDGPAKVNDYLILKSESPDPAAGHFSSSFRGRRIESSRLNLPPNQIGILVRLPDHEGIQSQMDPHPTFSERNQSKKMKTSQSQPQTQISASTDDSGLRRSPRKKSAPSKFPSAIPVNKQIQKFSMDSDEDEQDEEDDAEEAQKQKLEEEQEERERETERQRQRQREQEEVNEMQIDSDPMATSNDETMPEEVRKTLTPWATFGTDFLMWGPDAPLDLGDDPFQKSLTEWQKVSQVLHKF